MNPEEDTSEFVDALRSDLPSAEQSARIKARLAALAAVTAVGLASGSAAASTGAAAAATKAGLLASAVSRVGALSWGTKVGLAAAVSVSAAAGPVLLTNLDTGSREPMAAASAPRAAQQRSSVPRSPRTLPAREADRTEPPASALPAEPPSSVEGSAAERPPSRPARDRRPATRALAVPSPDTAWTATTNVDDGVPGAPVAAFATTDATNGASDAPAAPVTLSEAPASATTLREETALIDRAFAALRDGRLEVAAALVAAHQQRFPKGVLVRERERARAKLAELSRERGLSR